MEGAASGAHAGHAARGGALVVVQRHHVLQERVRQQLLRRGPQLRVPLEALAEEITLRALQE